MVELKKELEQIADLFYSEKIQEGTDAFLRKVKEISDNKNALPYMESFFDAIEAGDYTLAADLLHYEIAKNI